MFWLHACESVGKRVCSTGNGVFKLPGRLGIRKMMQAGQFMSYSSVQYLVTHNAKSTQHFSVEFKCILLHEAYIPLQDKKAKQMLPYVPKEVL